MALANSKLIGIPGLLTKLLQEPLGKCTLSEQRKLVIIDALDETKYKSKDNFLDLLMHRFPLLPKWLLFFITSRPKDTVQFTLKNHNRCVKICAEYGKHLNVYQEHEKDIKRFLEKRVDFSRLRYTVEDVARKCNGLFLYAFYMVKVLNNSACPGSVGELTELFPRGVDDFFHTNFERIFDKVKADLFTTLFGCVLASPSPIPRSFISFLLKREKSNLAEQEVIDTVSLFLVRGASDQTFTFLHNLIPSWLTDSNRARQFFVDITVAREYLKKIVLEFLPSSVINVSSGKYSSIETDLLDYVLHVGVRLLYKCDDTDSMKIAYNFLTSYQFIQKRIEKSRIGVYSLIGDLKLSAGCQYLSDTEKETLQGVCRALERSIHTLSECPHLLPSCLQMVSKAVKLNMTIPDGVSTTWMDWSWLPFPAAKAPHNKVRRCFAFYPDEKLLVQFEDECISLFNSCSLERLRDTVEVNKVSGVKGRKFLRIVHCSSEWFSFTLDRQHIVVKRKSLPPPTCWFCLLNHLCLWAKLEIAQSPEREPLCRCFPDKLKVTRNLPQLPAYQSSRITAMRPLLDLLSEMEQEEWYSLLQKIQLTRADGTFLVSSCGCCKTAKDYEALTLEEVRQFVIGHYFEIFKYQVLDLQTGKPVLNVALSSGVEVGPFIRFCHLGTAFEVCGTLFTGIGKALSLSNIALLSTICHHLLFRSRISEHLYPFNLFLPRSVTPFKWYLPGPDRTVSFIGDKGSVVSQNVTHVIRDINFYARVEDDIVLYATRESRLGALCLQTGTTTDLDSFYPYMRLSDLEQNLVEPRTFALSDDCTIVRLRENVTLSTYTFTDLSTDHTCEAIERASVLSTLSPIIALELENLPNEGKQVFFCDSIPCLSPSGVKWVAKPFVNDAESVVYLFEVIHPYPQQHSNNSKYVIKEVAHFGFTNDHSLFLYLSVHNTLHAFSLQSGTILQSVSGVSPLFFNFEGQAGYHFQADDEGKTLLLQDFPCDFLKHFLIPSARKPMQANFFSDDTFLVLYVDSSVASFQATGDRCADTSCSQRFSRSLGPWQVEKCAFSWDGKLIAAHHGNMITLHDTIRQDGCQLLCSIFEADYEFKVVELIFSADNALLLFCILRDRNCPFAFVWDVRKKVEPQSFDPPGLLSDNFCCCFTVDNKIVFCTELYIEIWDQAASPYHLFRRQALNVLYNETDRISFCTVSPNNDLLACCVVDRILLYSLDNLTNQPYLYKLPRAHLGKIEFCRFLNGNRYIISYGIDGAVFLWDLLERKAISFIRIPLEGDNISFMTVSPNENKVVGCTSFGGFFQISLKGLKSEMLSLEWFQLEEKRKEHNGLTYTGAVCPIAEQIAENTDTSKEVEEMDFMCPSDISEDSDRDESENSGADQ